MSDDDNKFDPMQVEGEIDEGEMYDRRERRPQPLNPVWGWSSSGRILVPAIPVGGQKEAIEEIGPLQIIFPKPGYHTVQFNLIQKFPPIDESVLNPLTLRARAEINWSVAGNHVKRVINVSDGTSISGTGEGCNVDIFDESFFDTTTGSDYEYEISVQVTPGARPNIAGSSGPIKNAEVGFIGIAGSPPEFDAATIFPIVNAAVPPSFASATGIYVPQNCGINAWYLNIATTAATEPVGNDFIIQQMGGAPGTLQPLSICNYDAVNKWVPLVPGTKMIVITNNYQNINPTNVFGSIIFGVDG